MIHPNMATMLGFVATDARVDAAARARGGRARGEPLVQLHHGRRRHLDQRFLHADRDRQARDMPEIDDAKSAEYAALADGVTAVAAELAQAIIRDGEGATKFITIRVEGGRKEEECRKVAYAIAHSPLVKTAFFASDPNLGRILAAVGYAGIADLEVDKVDLYLDDVLVAKNGGRSPGYREADGQRVMKQPEITVRVVLNRGAAAATVWTCDLSHDYVTINAEYRT